MAFKSSSTERPVKIPLPFRRRGGSTTDIVFVLLVLALIGAGLWWLIKSYGEAGREYSQALIQSQNNATDMSCQMNLRSVFQMLQVAVASEGAYPDSQEGLRQWCSDSRLLTCPDPNGGEYLYIPPKRMDSEAIHILLCDPKPVHQGRCSVLYTNGQMGFLTPDELKAMLAK